jgi:hypothetical protein
MRKPNVFEPNEHLNGSRVIADGVTGQHTATVPGFAVRHFTVAEIAAMWNLSPDYVRRIFEKEPGVLVLGDAKSARYKRRYRTLRIPEFVLARVHRRLTLV